MTREIPLGNGGVALVSDEDHERVSRFNWTRDGNGYVVRCVTVTHEDGTKHRRKIALHRFILEAPKGFDVDHANGDRLDNRRENIRLATRGQNEANKPARKGSFSRYKGVSWNKRDRVWMTEIRVNGERRYLGAFKSEIQAAAVYDRAAWQAWGPFAFLNFPQVIKQAA